MFCQILDAGGCERTEDSSNAYETVLPTDFLLQVLHSICGPLISAMNSCFCSIRSRSSSRKEDILSAKLDSKRLRTRTSKPFIFTYIFPTIRVFEFLKVFLFLSFFIYLLLLFLLLLFFFLSYTFFFFFFSFPCSFSTFQFTIIHNN